MEVRKQHELPSVRTTQKVTRFTDVSSATDLGIRTHAVPYGVKFTNKLQHVDDPILGPPLLSAEKNAF